MRTRLNKKRFFDFRTKERDRRSPVFSYILFVAPRSAAECSTREYFSLLPCPSSSESLDGGISWDEEENEGGKGEEKGEEEGERKTRLMIFEMRRKARFSPDVVVCTRAESTLGRI